VENQEKNKSKRIKERKEMIKLITKHHKEPILFKDNLDNLKKKE
jgi:hypothetical protein